MVLQVDGGVTVRADRRAVWGALHDPACLRLCVPGCRTLERRSATRFDLSVLVPLGPVTVVFDGTIEVIDSLPRQILVLKGRGTGGVTGLAAGTVRIDLADCASGCRLAYALEAEPSGPVSAMGSVLLASVARGLIERFGRTCAAVVGRPVLSTRPTTVRAEPAS